MRLPLSLLLFVVSTSLSRGQENRPDRMSFLDPSSCRTYITADYTRLPTLQDMLTEYILEARWHGGRIEVRATEDDGLTFFYSQRSLVLVDGEAEENHQAVMDLDPYRIRKIRIWPDCYLVDGIRYDGIISFELVH